MAADRAAAVGPKSRRELDMDPEILYHLDTPTMSDRAFLMGLVGAIIGLFSILGIGFWIAGMSN